MNSLEYEVAVRVLRQSKQAKDFIPFYRNVIKPILEHSVIHVLSGDHTLDEKRLVEVRAFAKSIRDIEIILNRIIIKGESAEKVIKENITRGEQ